MQSTTSKQWRPNKVVEFLIVFGCGVAALTSTVHAAPAVDACEDGELRYRHLGKIISVKSQYCFNSAHTSLISKNCEPVKSTCAARRAASKKVPPLSSFYSQAGAPGFNLCRFLGGSPQIVNFRVKDKWYNLDRCIFEEDGSYVDTGRLYALVRDNADKK